MNIPLRAALSCSVGASALLWAIQANAQAYNFNIPSKAAVAAEKADSAPEPTILQPIIVAQAQTPQTMGAAAMVAQAAAPAAPLQAGSEVPEQVLVTGSLLAGANFAAPTPVTQVSEIQVQTRALTGVGTVIEELPFAVVGSGLTRNTSGNQRAGQSYPNLRGLGADNALVLIDGMRPTPVNSTNNFDTNMIPQSMLDRFEVVTTGASATYGSDAVAGAVNFVLKTQQEGFTSDVRYGTSQRGDTNQNFVSAAWGTTLLDGRGHFIIGAEYARQYNTVNMYARDWGRNEPGLVTLPVKTAQSLGLPANLLVNNAEPDNGTDGGLITACQKGAATAVCPAGLASITFDASGTTPSAFKLGQVAGSTYMIGTANYGDASQSRLISPPYDRWASMARFEYDFTPDITGFVMVDYGGLESANTSQGTAPNIKVLTGNPFIPASVQSTMTANGITSFTLSKLNLDGTERGKPFDNKNTLIQSFFGLKGALPGDWNWSLRGSAGRANVWQASVNVVAPANLDLAMNGCNPLTSSSQVALLNPGTGAVTTSSTPAQINALATPGCVAFNPFGTPTAAMMNYVTNPPQAPAGFEANVRQYMGQVDLSGPLFDLPAGPLDLAVGGNYRYNSYNQRAYPAAISGLFTTPTTSFFLNQHVWEGYSEVGIPVVKDLPFAQSVDLSVAGRYTDYSISGPVWTWKYGGTWDVFDWLRLRATRSQDIRAPNFSEISTVSTGGGANVQNPINGVSGALTAGSRTTGNPDVHPEVSQNVTAGFVIQPTSDEGEWISGFRASVDYYRIRISGQIATLAAQAVTNGCLLQKIPDLCKQIVFAPGFNENSFTPTTPDFGIAGFVLQDINLASTYQDGFDINLSQRVPLDNTGIPGGLELSVLASYINKQAVSTGVVDNTGKTIVTTINYADSWSAPRWGVNLNLTYFLDRFSANLQMRYYTPQRFVSSSGSLLAGPTGSFNIGPDDPNYAAALAAGSSLTINQAVFPASYQFNLGFTYDVIKEPDGRNLQAYLNIDNLFDKDPPIIWWYTSNYDVVGRYFKIGLRYTMP